MIGRRAENDSFRDPQSSTERPKEFQSNCRPLSTTRAGKRSDEKLAVLHDLPVELLYEILLLSLNPSFTLVSRHIHLVFKSTSTHFRADYLIEATKSLGKYQYSFKLWWRDRLETWLRYGICDFEVLQLLINQTRPPKPRDRDYPFHFGDNFELPKRILRSFASVESEGQESRWAREATAMGFLRYLLSPVKLPASAPAQDSQPSSPKTVTLSGSSNSHEGYFLRQAVHLEHEPLIDLLLAHDCDPLQKAGIAVKLAIRRKDERMVRKLFSKGNVGRLCFSPVGRHLLEYSAEVGARDIANFFIKETHIVPKPETLKLLSN
ncbi:hypothetical protein M407DRAFT_88215 [Tulasnella calospora MUT 4182]|uniref:F-box domain-containing protein n=1 Tax=Tulasnella calospora MUT 4182 TaxID=1051891 RepID=A0A0C3QX35_9AGAM|nr:hypothetical protein M407DRAFT_88215 [Tulasnella calospora MUT 4182]